jgi:hypothetical protein
MMRVSSRHVLVPNTCGCQWLVPWLQRTAAGSGGRAAAKATHRRGASASELNVAFARCCLAARLLHTILATGLAWTRDHQKRRTISYHARTSAPAPPPPPAAGEAGPPGAHFRHALHGTVGLTRAPRSSAEDPASPISRLVHPHTTALPPTRPPVSTGRLLPTRTGRGPGPPPGVTCRAGRARRTVQAARSGPSNARSSPRSSPARASRLLPHRLGTTASCTSSLTHDHFYLPSHESLHTVKAVACTHNA